MGWVILVIVLLAAALGVLGAVLKLAAAFILGLVLVVAILVTVAWFSLKHWARDMQRQADAQGGTDGGSTTYYEKRGDSYDVRGWVRREDGEDDPDQE